MPDISVVIPSYNYGAYIGETIESVLAQLHEADELIVVDDGSTDDTRSKMEPYLENKRVRYIYQENGGVSVARNHGASLAANEYLYFLDADDQVLEGGLDTLRRAAADHPDAAMVIGGHVTDDFRGNRRTHRQRAVGQNPEQNFIDYVIHKKFTIANGGTALIRRSAARQFPYPENLKVSDDFCVFAWIVANYPCVSVQGPVVLVRKHDDSLRNQLPRYEHDVRLLPDMVFDPDKIPAALLQWKHRFACNRLLSLFRAQYIAGADVSARKTYLDAISCRPLNLLRLSYLRKYIRLLLRPGQARPA